MAHNWAIEVVAAGTYSPVPDNGYQVEENVVTMRLSPAEISLMWRALTFHKNAMTRNGRIWNKHTANAHLRTRLEGLR